MVQHALDRMLMCGDGQFSLAVLQPLNISHIPLEKEMATHLQYSYLENPVDRAAWWATSFPCSSVSKESAGNARDLSTESQRVRHN